MSRKLVLVTLLLLCATLLCSCSIQVPSGKYTYDVAANFTLTLDTEAGTAVLAGPETDPITVTWKCDGPAMYLTHDEWRFTAYHTMDQVLTPDENGQWALTSGVVT